MAKKTEVKKATTMKSDISFGSWIKEVARARGEVGALVTELRNEKALTLKTNLKTATEKFGKRPQFDVLAGRYNGFLRRGSQAKAAA